MKATDSHLITGSVIPATSAAQTAPLRLPQLTNAVSKGTKLYSILFNKCPRCQEGDFFKSKSAFNLKNFDEMHEHCPACSFRYEQEPGFFTGSMYISYALFVATIVTSFVGFALIFDVDVVYLLWFLIPAMILLTPFYFRLARRVWINFFVSYQGTSDKTQMYDSIN